MDALQPGTGPIRCATRPPATADVALIDSAAATA